MRRLTVAFLILLLACSSGYVFAQATATGSISGTVTDGTGAIVTGAQVQATQKSTGKTRTMTTGDSGFFNFELLPASLYEVKITKAGFNTVVKTVELLVGTTANVSTTLRPGATSEVVEVTGAAPLVDTEKTGVSQSITPAEVQDLPLNGRDFGSLAVLAPGARPADSYDPTKNRIAVFSVNGGAGRDVNMTVNGVDNKDNTVGGPVMQLPLEAVQEFAISTDRFSAANGRSEGAAVNVITKSGTNAFHGAGYFFDTETAFNAKDFFTAQNPDSKKKDYSRQQFGGSIGGPVRRDKDFLFFALERVREHTATAVNPDSFALLQLMSQFGAQPSASIPTPYFDWRYTGRYDHHFNSNHNFFVTYNYQTNTGLNDQNTNQTDLSQNNFTTNRLILANATLNSVLSPRVVNSFTFGHQYWNNVIDTKNLVPLVTFPDGTQFGTNGNVSQQSLQKKWQFRDDLSISRGKHNFKTGVDYVWEPTLGGFFTFNQTLEIDLDVNPKTAADVAALAQPGHVIGLSQSVGNPREDIPGGVKQFGMYFQDDWKLKRNFTVNLGIRWDKDIGFLAGDIQAKNRTFLALKAINSPFTASLPHDYNKAFSPRVGFAWDIAGNARHVVRGGYGLYYGQTFLNIPLFMIQQANPTIFATTLNVTDGATLVPGLGIAMQDTTLAGLLANPPAVPAAPTDLPPNTVGRLVDPSYRPPYTQQFNLGYAFALNPNNLFEIEYVHTLSLHTSKTININPLLPAGGGRELDGAFAANGVTPLNRIDNEESIDRSRYDGLNFSYRRRMSKHLSINTNYVLSRAVCYYCYLGANAFRNRPPDPHNPLDPRYFGSAPNDERHHWTFSGVVDIPGGIEVSPIMQVASARPWNGQSTVDFLGFGQSLGTVRPALVPVADRNNLFALAGLTKAQGQACLAAGTCTTTGFDTFRGQAFFNLDLRVSKTIKLGESKELKLLSQFFDLTNRSNFGGNFDNTQQSDTVTKPNAYITPASVVIPQSFRAEFGAIFRF